MNMKRIGLRKKLNIFIDPRHKMEFVKFALLEMFKDEKGDIMAAKVEHVTRAYWVCLES